MNPKRLQERGTVAAVRDSLNRITVRHRATTSAKSLLTNEVYADIQQLGQWRNETAHPAIVERETW